jgi:SAM-dependent methyltransferase
MADVTVTFDDGAAYESFMGRWSRAVGVSFLDWLSVPLGVRWLEVGCGTGAFTELLLDAQLPAAVVAIDPAASQIDYARKRIPGSGVEFRVSDAQKLPFPTDSFDVVASALVITFIPDRPRALAEMVRVCRPGGHVGGYVWDLAAMRNPGWPLARGLREIGVEPAPMPGAADSSTEALQLLFVRAGLEDVAVQSIDVTMTFFDFDDFWRSQTPAISPQGKIIAKLSESELVKLGEAVRAAVPVRRDGSIAFTARANAIKSRVPALLPRNYV